MCGYPSENKSSVNMFVYNKKFTYEKNFKSKGIDNLIQITGKMVMDLIDFVITTKWTYYCHKNVNSLTFPVLDLIYVSVYARYLFLSQLL